MEIHRSTFRTMLWDAIQQREKYEREILKYTRDSSHLAVMREMLTKTEYEESVIYLRN